MRALLHQMLNARFAEIARQTDAPFLRASSGDDDVRPDGRGVLGVGACEGRRHREGLRGARMKMSRGPPAWLRRGGARSRRSAAAIASYEAPTTSAGQLESGRLCVRTASQLSDRGGRAWHRDRGRPGRHSCRRSPPRRSGRSRATLHRRQPRRHRDRPEKAGLAAVTEPSLRDALPPGTSATVTAWRDEIGGASCIANKPQPGKVASRRRDPRDWRHRARRCRTASRCG